MEREGEHGAGRGGRLEWRGVTGRMAGGRYRKEYIGGPTPTYFAKRLTEMMGGAQIWLKREELAHTGPRPRHLLRTPRYLLRTPSYLLCPPCYLRRFDMSCSGCQMRGTDYETCARPVPQARTRSTTLSDRS